MICRAVMMGIVLLSLLPPPVLSAPLDTFTIDGCVEHFRGCGGSREFGSVRLSPLDRVATVELGYFSFADVPPGDYTLTYSPACNPAGCTGAERVRIVDGDGYASFYRSNCTADCSADYRVTVDEVLSCVNRVLGRAAGCQLCDADQRGQPSIDDLLAGVGALLHGCR